MIRFEGSQMITDRRVNGFSAPLLPLIGETVHAEESAEPAEEQESRLAVTKV